MLEIEYTGFEPQAANEASPALSLDGLLIRNKSACFFAMMRGHAMARAGVRNGDLLVIEPAEAYRDGAIVLAFIDYEALVRRLDGGMLVAANPNFKSQALDDPSVIRGQVVASIKVLAKPRFMLPPVVS